MIETEEEAGPLFLAPREQFDPCIVGMGRRFTQTFVVYDEACILAALADENPDDDDPWTTAREHYEFNIVGGWVGDGTPAFVSELGPE